MSFVKRLTLGCAIGLITLCFVAPIRAQAQTDKPAESGQGDRDQTLKQLLTEVRELRLAVQRATVSNTRFQMQKLKVDIQYKFEETEQGARICISTNSPDALRAIYDFLRFQIKEHKTGDSMDVGQ